MDGVTLPPSPMQSLQAEHERLLARLDEIGGAPCPGPAPVSLDALPLDTQALVHEARFYIERSRMESEWIAEARDRSQLRANLRFWASFLLNCTGTYPDTTLLPARAYRSQLSELPGTSQSGMETVYQTGETSAKMNGEIPAETRSVYQGEYSEQADSDFIPAVQSEKPAWFSKISRMMGLVAILIVGAIPLAAVCLALSLFYSLDNQSYWAWSGNYATQTANVASRSPVNTPELPGIQTPLPTLSLPGFNPGTELPLVFARVTSKKSSNDGSGCFPKLLLNLNAPAVIDGTAIPPGDVMVSLAGSDQVVASGILEPGSDPLALELGAGDLPQRPLDWLIQVEHPWLDVEAVIITRSMLTDCASQQVLIEYQSGAGLETWRTARNKPVEGDLGLTWSLLTWGPDALEGLDWVAAFRLQASGGNGKYVYFAEGNLAAPSAGRVMGSLLPGDQVVLGQRSCMSGVARVGVTSAGQVLRRALAVQLVTPECR